MSIEPPSVLLVGASRGIGRATAAYLAERGLRVFAGARKPEDVAKLSASSPPLEGVLIDVTDDHSIEAARAEIEASLAGAGLCGLVYCAAASPGSQGSGRPMEHVTRETLRHLFEVNTFGMALTVSAFMPLLRKARGRVGNVGGGGSAIMALPLMGAGSASKFAVEAMSDALRLELRRAGVHVSLVEPGMTYRDADRDAFRREMNADLDAVRASIPESNRSYYVAVIENQRRFLEGWLARAAPPEKVSRRIHHALTSRRPRTRYWCGWESKAAVLISRLSTGRMRDALWGRIVGL